MEGVYKRAVTAHREGALIDLDVTPGAKEARFPAGADPWRQRIRIRVQAPPQDGAANQEVRRLVAQRLGVRPDDVTLVKGQTSSRKTLHVAGCPPQRVLDRLLEAAP